MRVCLIAREGDRRLKGGRRALASRELLLLPFKEGGILISSGPLAPLVASFRAVPAGPRPKRLLIKGAMRITLALTWSRASGIRTLGAAPARDSRGALGVAASGTVAKRRRPGWGCWSGADGQSQGNLREAGPRKRGSPGRPLPRAKKNNPFAPPPGSLAPPLPSVDRKSVV